jgi:phosphohistidine phosphatase SixA
MNLCCCFFRVQRSKATDAAACDVSSDPFVQNLFVMCHGEHVEYKDIQPSGLALRPWDPPLTEGGKLQAWRVGRIIRLEDWNVTRVVVSPFLRCVQTAAEVIAGFSSVTAAAAGESHPASPNTYSGNPSIKVCYPRKPFTH